MASKTKLTKAMKAWASQADHGDPLSWYATDWERRDHTGNPEPCYIVPAAEYERLTKRRKARNAK